MSKRPEYQLASVAELFKTTEEREEDKLERVQIIPAEQIHPYPREPYQVGRATADLAQLMDSIERVGIAEPMIVRPRAEGGYEILAGHRRDYCARQLGLPNRPVIVRHYDDATADVLVSDYNITREDLLPSEKARAYALWMDGMRRQGQRVDSTSLQIGEKLAGKLSVQLLAEKVSENATNIQRYIRLTHLIRPLLDRVDEKKLGLVPAADYLYKLTEEEQSHLQALLEAGKPAPSLEQAQQMKRLSEAGLLTEEEMGKILQKKVKEKKVVLKQTRLQEYFPAAFTEKQMEEVILQLLKDWRREHGEL